jgi:hypothetical protein
MVFLVSFGFQTSVGSSSSFRYYQCMRYNFMSKSSSNCEVDIDFPTPVSLPLPLLPPPREIFAAPEHD